MAQALDPEELQFLKQHQPRVPQNKDEADVLALHERKNNPFYHVTDAAREAIGPPQPGIADPFWKGDTFRDLPREGKRDWLNRHSEDFANYSRDDQDAYIESQTFGLETGMFGGETLPPFTPKQNRQHVLGMIADANLQRSEDVRYAARATRAHTLGPLARAGSQVARFVQGGVKLLRDGEFDEAPETFDLGWGPISLTPDPNSLVPLGSPLQAGIKLGHYAKQLFDVAARKMGLADAEALKWVESVIGQTAGSLEEFGHMDDPSQAVREPEEVTERRRQDILDAGGVPGKPHTITLQEGHGLRAPVWMVQDGVRRLTPEGLRVRHGNLVPDPRWGIEEAEPRIEVELPWDPIYHENEMEIPYGVGPLMRAIYETAGIVPPIGKLAQGLGAIPKIGRYARHTALPMFAYGAAKGAGESPDIQAQAAAGGAQLALGLHATGYLPSPYLRALAGAVLFGGRELVSTAQGEMPWTEGIPNAIIGAWFGVKTPYNPRMRFTPEQLEVKRQKLMALAEFKPVGKWSSGSLGVQGARQRERLMEFLDEYGTGETTEMRIRNRERGLVPEGLAAFPGERRAPRDTVVKEEPFTETEKAEILRVFDEAGIRAKDDPNWDVDLTYGQRTLAYPEPEPEPLMLPAGGPVALLAPGARPTETPHPKQVPVKQGSYDWHVEKAKEQGFSGEAAHVYARAETRKRIHPAATTWLDSKHSKPIGQLADYLERLGEGWVHLDALALAAHGKADVVNIRKVGRKIESLWKKGVLEFQMQENGWGAYRLRQADSAPAPGQEPPQAGKKPRTGTKAKEKVAEEPQLEELPPEKPGAAPAPEPPPKPAEAKGAAKPTDFSRDDWVKRRVQEFKAKGNKDPAQLDSVAKSAGREWDTAKGSEDLIGKHTGGAPAEPEAAPPPKPKKVKKGAYVPAGPPEIPAGEDVKLAPRSDGTEVRAVWGDEQPMEMADGATIKTRYVLMEEGDSIASHDPKLGFAPTPGYDPRNQTKDYAANFEFQARVIENAGGKRKANLVNTPSETGEHGPPQMLPSRDIVGGNGRAMSQRLQTDETLQAEALTGLTANPQFGIDPAALSGFQRPVVRRVITSRIPQTEAEATALSHDLNRNFTAKATGEAEGAGLAARMSDATVRVIDASLDSAGEKATFRDMMDGNKELVSALIKDGIILPNEVKQYVTDEGSLNSRGKELVEQILFSKISSDATLRDKVNADLKARLLRMGPALLRAKSYNVGEFEELLNEAIASEVGRFHKKQDIDDFMAVMPGEGLSPYPSQQDPRVAALHRLLAPKQYGGMTPLEAKNRTVRLAERMKEIASGQQRMFGEDMTLDKALQETLKPMDAQVEAEAKAEEAAPSTEPQPGELVVVNVGNYKKANLKEGTVLKVWTDKNGVQKVQVKIPKEGYEDKFYKKTFRLEDIKRRPEEDEDPSEPLLMSELIEAEVDASVEVSKFREGNTSSIFHGNASVREARVRLGRGWNWKGHSDFPLEAPGLAVPKGARKKGDILRDLAKLFKQPIQQGGLPHVPPAKRAKRPQVEGRIEDDTVLGVHGFLRLRDPKAVHRGSHMLGDIHIKHWGDIHVAAHEIAHAIDIMYPQFSELWNYNDAQLHEMAMGKDPGKFQILKELMGVSYEVTDPMEGFAEFMRLWFTAKDAAQNRAPNAYAEIEKLIRKLPRKHAKGLFRAQKQMHDYFGQDAGRAIDNMYGDPGGNPGMIMNGLSGRAREILMDDLQGILSAERHLKGNYTADGAYEFSRLLRGAGESAETMMYEGAPAWIKDSMGRNTYQTEYVGEGIADILEPVALNKDRMKKFWRYADARMAKEMELQTRNKDFTPNMIKTGMSYESLPQFKQTFDKLVEFNSKVADYGREAGLWNAEQQANWKRHEYAMGLFRHMASTGAQRKEGGPGSLVGDIGVYTSFGSTRQLKKPMDRLLEGPSRILHMARENVAKKEIIRLLESPGGGAFGARVPPRAERIQVGMKKIKESIQREFRDMGFRIPDEYFDALGVVDRVTLYLGGKQPYETKGSGNQIMRYFDKGKPVYYELYDPLLIRAIQSFRRPGATGFEYWGDALRRFRQAGVTSTIDFMVRNAVRDPLLATITTKTGFQHFTAALRGYWSAATRDKYFIESLANGGGGDLIRRHGHRPWEKYVVKRAQRKNHDLRGYSFNPISDTWRQFTKIGRIIEQGPRMGEFIRARKKGMTRTHAAFLKRNVSTDFAMQGEAITGQGKAARLFMNTTPFMNAMAVGTDKLWQNIVRDPSHRGLSAMRLGLFSLGALQLHLALKGDPEYDGMADWDKRANLHWKVDGQMYRTPTIWEAGMVANVTREFYELFANSPDISDRSIAESFRIYGQHFMGFTKNVAETMRENFRMGLPMGQELTAMYFRNKDYFTGTPIVPLGLERTFGAQQIRSRQARTMHKLGAMMEERDIDISPAKAEAFARFLFSTWTTYGLMLSDRYAFPGGPSMHGDDKAIMRNFKERPHKYPQAEQDYYDLFSEIEIQYNRFKKLENKINNEFIGDEELVRLDRRMEVLEDRGVVEAGEQWEAINREIQVLNDEISDLRTGTGKTEEERDYLRDEAEALRLERLEMMEEQLKYGDVPEGVERPR